MPDIDIEKIVQSVVAAVSAQGVQTVASSANTVPATATPTPRRGADVPRRIAIGADFRGAKAKEAVKPYLDSLGYQVTDVGTPAGDDTDYPDVAFAVARKVATGTCDRGIVFDGDGIGSAVVCNKVDGIRAALCYDMRTIINSRERLNANVLALGGPFHNDGELCEMTRAWLETRFRGDLEWRRLRKIKETENRKT